jgi:hypothetical protein
MDENGRWKLKSILVELFVCGGCKSIFGQLVSEHDVVGKGCYDMRICMGNMAKSKQPSPLALHIRNYIS